MQARIAAPAPVDQPACAHDEELVEQQEQHRPPEQELHERAGREPEAEALAELAEEAGCREREEGAEQVGQGQEGEGAQRPWQPAFVRWLWAPRRLVR